MYIWKWACYLLITIAYVAAAVFRGGITATNTVSHIAHKENHDYEW